MKQFKIALLAAAALLAGNLNTTYAHFVWVEVVNADGGKQQVRVAFSEAGEAGAAYLVDRIAHAKVTSFPGGTKQLEMKPAVTGETGWLVSSVDATNRVQLECKYGIFARGESASLLHYYASFETFALAGQPNGQQNDTLLKLQVRPSGNAEELRLTVFWEGKPSAGDELVLISPDGTETNTITNENGEVLIAEPLPGVYRARARHAVEKAGTEEGESYAEELHYSTLTLNVTGNSKDAEAGTEEAPTAAEMLSRARAGRALWEDFPGFEAEILVVENGERMSGAITVDEYGTLNLVGIKLGDRSRVEQTLRSLISHRMGSGEASDQVSFADDDTQHPFGRLINLDYDSSMGSAYRVKDDVIREVNRQMGDSRFTISVLSVYRNPTGQYLPSDYAMHTWGPDNALLNSTVVRDTWVRVGGFDLPESHTSVTATAGQLSQLRIEFSGHKLSDE